MKQIWKRLSAETPTFFKKLQIFGGSLSATGIAVSTINGIPEVLKSHASTAIWVGAVIAAVSQMACKNPNDLNDKQFPGNNARV